MEALGDRVQLVGDEISVTNFDRMWKGIEVEVANSVCETSFASSSEATPARSSNGVTLGIPTLRHRTIRIARALGAFLLSR